MAVTITRTAWTDDDGSGTTGTVINNAAKTSLYDQIDTALALLLPLAGGTLVGDLKFTDNTYDIGKSGATRPRDGFFARNVAIASNLGVGLTPSYRVDITSGVASDRGANILMTGTGTVYGAVLTLSGASTQNTGLYVDVTNASTNYAAIFNTGIVGISTTSPTNKLQVHGSVSIGAGTARAGTAGTNRLDIFDGTAPTSTLANGISLYSTSGELRVMDAGGTATLLSPHDAQTREWIFDSVDTATGARLRIDVERLLRAVDRQLGGGYVHEGAA